MKRSSLLDQVKHAVHEVEPGAEIILYGSRSRGEAGAESDWDFLVLLDGPVDDARTDRVRHRLYEVEWASDEVISAVVRSRQTWRSHRSRAMPFHQQVERDGITL